MYISSPAEDSAIGGILLQNAGSMGYSSMQDFERVFPGESGPPTKKKNQIYWHWGFFKEIARQLTLQWSPQSIKSHQQEKDTQKSPLENNLENANTPIEMENSIERLKDKVEKNLEIRRNPEKQRK